MRLSEFGLSKMPSGPGRLTIALSAGCLLLSLWQPACAGEGQGRRSPKEKTAATRQAPEFIPSPGSLRMVGGLSDRTRYRIEQIVESSNWMSLQRRIMQVARASKLPPRGGPDPSNGQPNGQEQGIDLLAAMVGAEAPSPHNSFSAGQKQAIAEIKALESQQRCEWIKVWSQVRPLLSEDNLRELRALNAGSPSGKGHSRRIP